MMGNDGEELRFHVRHDLRWPISRDGHERRSHPKRRLDPRLTRILAKTWPCIWASNCPRISFCALRFPSRHAAKYSPRFSCPFLSRDVSDTPCGAQKALKQRWYLECVEELTAIGAVRKRPGMYVGDTDDGSGLINLMLDVIANAYDQYLAGRCSSISLTIAADGTVTVEDDGPGLPAAGGDGLPSLDTVLTQLSTKPTLDGHRPHVHLGLGGLGLVVVNALSEEFELISVHDGTEVRAKYARGEVVEPIATTGTKRASGTRIRFRPDPVIFKHVRAPRAELTRTLEDLTFLAPNLHFRWSIEGDELAARGLVARVAIDVPCAFDEVAHTRESYETAKGPIEVEVALAWRTSRFHANAEPVIHSFVNLGRTRGDGMHVQGLLDGVHAFLDGGRRDANAQGLVAAVSVVLADVIYGNPTKDRLDSPGARKPVSEATQKALAAWARAHPLAAENVRGRQN